MGITRKVMSIGTLGLVKYRTDSERQALYAKQTRNAARVNNAQNMQLIELQRDQLAAEQLAQTMRATQVAAAMSLQTQRAAPPSLPPGWYADPSDSRALCWWDGMQWLRETKHFPGQPPAVSQGQL